MRRTTFSPEVLISNFIRHIDYCDWILLFFLSCSRQFQGQGHFVLHRSYCHWRHAVRASEIGVKQTWNICGPPLHTNPSQFHPPPTTYIPTIHLNNEVPTQSGANLNNEVPTQSGANLNNEVPTQSGATQRSRYSDLLRTGQSGDRSPVSERFFAPVQTGPGAYPPSYTIGTRSYPGVKRPERDVDHSPHLAPRLIKEQSYTSTPLWVFVTCYRVNILIYLIK